MLCKHTPFKTFDIWTPRWHDRRVLLATHKVGEHNRILFSKAPSLGEAPYYLSGKTIRKFKKESNGTIDCFSVPLDELKPLELEERCQHEWN